MTGAADEVTDVPAWIRPLAAAHLAEVDHRTGCEGTLRYIDAGARLRGVRAVERGVSVSLSRPVGPGRSVRHAEPRPTYLLETYAETIGSLTIGSDRLEVDCHGMENTHLDGLSHIGLAGGWHGGPLRGCSGSEALVGASTGISTRVIVVDIPASRDTRWAAPEPVEGAELEAAVASAGLCVERGDALMVYMGRDEFERAGHSYGPISEFPGGRPGLGRSGAEFLADCKVSALCWDFLDAHGDAADVLPAHILAWGVGLVLIDNCDLGPAVRALSGARKGSAQLTVAPLRLSGATGCLVNPVLLY
jgi:kynurenine formamidase